MKKMNYALLSTILIFGTLLPKQTIFDEVRAGNTQAIKKRIENCENCAEKDENGNNALHIAAEEEAEEHQAIIDMLTTQPDYSSWNNWFYGFFYAPTLPNKNEKNKQGKVPLRCAMERGNIGATEKLIIKGANPNIADTEGISPVFSVVKENKPQLIPLLVKHQLIQQKQNGQNILHYAININQLSMVDRLATNNSLTQEEDNQGRTPAMLAAEKEDASCLRILHVKGVNLNARNRFGQQPIHSSAIAGSYESAKYLLEINSNVNATDNNINSTDNNDDTPLLLSTKRGKKEVVDLFLAHKADITKRNKQGQDILALAVAHKHSELIKRFKNIPELDIDRRDALGRTEFMNAVISKNHSMMSALYDCSANPYIADHEGENVFHKIAKNDDTNGLSLIISIQPNEKDWNKKNNDGNTPTFVAAQHGSLNTITMLIHSSAFLEGTNNAGETIFHQIAKSKKPSMLTAIMQYNPQTNINAQSRAGFSPMHYASSYDDVDMMYAFAGYGASYTDTTPHGDTLAHTAAKSGALKSLKDLKYRKPMMLQERNKNNHTPFIIAAANGKIDATDFLFCEEWIINRDISIAINLSHQNKHTHVVRFLKKKEEERMDACIALSNQPQAIINTHKDIQYFDLQVAAKNPAHLVTMALRDQLPSPKQYSANELYYMTQAQRTQIALEYKKLYKSAQERKKELNRELNRLIAQEQEEVRKQDERIRQERKAAKQREREALIMQMQAQEAAQKKAEEDRIKREQQKEFDHYAQEQQKKEAVKAQDEALKKHNEQKKKEDDLIAGQQAILDDCAAKKALADAAKHKAALEKQQEYVQMNLQPSAPPVEEKKATAAYECATCGKKSTAKTLPCKTCPKRMCDACQKQNGGQCTTCWETIGKFAQKIKGGCFICTEENIDVTTVPCNLCKKRNDHICKDCLNDCLKENAKDIKLDGKCPLCTEAHMLDKKIIKIILSQK